MLIIAKLLLVFVSAFCGVTLLKNAAMQSSLVQLLNDINRSSLKVGLPFHIQWVQHLCKAVCVFAAVLYSQC